MSCKLYHLKFLLVYENITCKRGSAEVVRTSYRSYGKGQILHLSRALTTVPINTKLWTIDYLGEKKRIAICSRGVSPHVGEI